MRLSTKLITATLALVLIPILILAFSLLWLSVYRPRTLSPGSGGQEELSIMDINVIRRFDRLMSRLDGELKEAQRFDRDALLKESVLEDISGRFEKDEAYLLAYAGDCYFNGGIDNADILAFVSDTASITGGEMLYFAGLQAPDLIGCFEFTTSAGQRGEVYLVCDVSGSLPSLQRLIILIALSVFALIVGFFILSFWVQFHLAKPVRELKKAAKEIKEGNLDYRIDTDDGDEFGELCRDFEEMRQRLKDNADEQLQYEEDNRILLSNITHDLKTPITAIKGYVEGIQDGVASSPEKMQRYLTTIYNKADDLDRLVDELGFYSKIDMSRIPYHFLKIPVQAYFEDCREELTPELEAQDVELHFENTPDADAVMIGDPEQLHRVMNNIISNAVKYMDKPQRRIGVRVEALPDVIRIRVEDNGRGIAAEDLPYIFDRFYRTDQSRSSRTGGSGIGLSIVKKVVEDHGGRILAESRQGEGTAMTLELQRYRESDAAPAADGDGTEEEKQKTAHWRRRKRRASRTGGEDEQDPDRGR